MPLKTDLEQVKKQVKIIIRAVPIKEESELFISHPMTNTVITYVPDSNNNPKPVNLAKKKDLKEWLSFCDRIIEEADSVGVLMLRILKPYKLTMLKYCKPYIEKKEFSECLADAWVMSENPNDDVNCPVSELIGWFKEADQRSLMSDKEYKVWKSLPNKMTLYRGVANGHNPKGLSWTLKREKAEWFRDRWKDSSIFAKNDRYLLQAEVNKKDCFCYFNSRGEEEIVVNTSKIKSKRID